MNNDFFRHLLSRLKIFWTAMILVFFVVSLQYLGLQSPNILPYLSAKIQTFFSPIQPSSTVPIIHTQASNTTKGGE